MALRLFLFFCIMTAAFSAQPLVASAQDISLDNLKSPTAREVLDQIEGKDSASAPPPAPPIEKADEGTATLYFPVAQIELSAEQKGQIVLFASVVKPEQRVSVVSYATPEEGDPASARRVSLERALIVRDFLKSEKISGRQIDIFPMGDQMPAPAENKLILRINAL